MINVRPDPEHRLGGSAILDFTAGPPGKAEVMIAVFDKFRSQYLGPDGFQPHRHDFGPYPVEAENGRCFVRVGSEIVNRVEEYASLRLFVGPVEADVSWPDDVIPLEGAPRLGQLQTAPEPEPAPVPEPPKQTLQRDDTVVVPLPEAPPPVEAPEAVEEAHAEEHAEPEPQEQPRGGKSWILWPVALLIVAAAGGAYWYAQQDQAALPPPSPAPMLTPPAPVTPVAEPADPCGLDGLRGVFAEDVSAGLDRLRGCGGAVSAETAFTLIEAGWRGGDAEATALMGMFYDSGQTDPIEAFTGLSMAEDLKNAVRYYRSARDSGYAEAGDMLSDACERLGAMGDTLSQSAIDDYCGD